MRICSNLLQKGLKVVKDSIGLYSKKDCTRIAIDIGKDLVDTSRKDIKIDESIWTQVIKKHVPRADIKFYTTKESFIEELKRAGENYEALEGSLANYRALFFDFKKTKGIYAPGKESLSDISAISHEIEHYLYDEHTFLRKMLIKLARKIPSKQAAKPDVGKIAPKGSFITKSETASYKQISAEASIQSDIWSFFGLKNLSIMGKLKDVMPTEEAVTEFLKSDAYKGLTSDKRISAYIRGIVRAHMHPKNKDSLAKLVLTKTTLDDEVRAYTVSDVIERYRTGSETITNEGFIAQIYKRTSKIIKGDIKRYFKLAGEDKLIKNGETPIKTALPTRACSNDLFGLAEYGEPIKLEPIKISDLKKKVFDEERKIKRNFVNFEA